MSFFDSKEEVINLELTSYGKFLLSKGYIYKGENNWDDMYKHSSI